MFIIDDLLIIGAAALAGGLAGGIIGGVIAFLDEDSIANEVREQCPDAFMILIKEKKKNSVNVGIFGKQNIEIKSDLEISSSEGVSDNVHVGQKIYL